MYGAYDPCVDCKCKRNARRQHEGKEIEMHEEFRVLGSEVISKTAFGSNYKEGENMFDMLKKLVELIFPILFQPRFPLVG